LNNLWWLAIVFIISSNLSIANEIIYKDSASPSRFELFFSKKNNELILYKYSGRFIPRTQRFHYSLVGPRSIPIVYHEVQKDLGSLWNESFSQDLLWDLDYDKSSVLSNIIIQLHPQNNFNRSPSSDQREYSLGAFAPDYELLLRLDDNERPMELNLKAINGDLSDFSVKKSGDYTSLFTHEKKHLVTFYEVPQTRDEFIAFDLIFINDNNHINEIELKRVHLFKVNDKFVIDSSLEKISESKDSEIRKYFKEITPSLEIEEQFRNCLVYQNYSSLSQIKSGLQRECLAEIDIELQFKELGLNPHQTALARQCLLENGLGQLHTYPFGQAFFLGGVGRFDQGLLSSCVEKILSVIVEDYRWSISNKLNILGYHSLDLTSFSDSVSVVSDCWSSRFNCKQQLLESLKSQLIDSLDRSTEKFHHEKKNLLVSCLESGSDLDELVNKRLVQCHNNIKKIGDLPSLKKSLSSELHFLSNENDHKNHLIDNAIVSQMIHGWNDEDVLEDLLLARIAVWKHHEIARVVSNGDLIKLSKLNEEWLLAITNNHSAQINFDEAYYQLIRSKLPGLSRQDHLLEFILRVIPEGLRNMPFFSSCVQDKNSIVDCWLKQNGLLMLDQLQLEMEELSSMRAINNEISTQKILSPLSGAHLCVLNQNTQDPYIYFSRVRGCLALARFDIANNFFGKTKHEQAKVTQCLFDVINVDLQETITSAFLLDEKIELLAVANSLLPHKLLRSSQISELRLSLENSLIDLGNAGEGLGECLFRN
jgi:hypothetical protein